MMKKVVFTLLVALFVTTAVSAQRPERQPKFGHKGEISPEKMVDQRVEKMTRELNLSDEQQAKVREILTDEANYENQVRQMVMKRKKQNAEKIEQLLTPDQKAKRDEVCKQGKGSKGKPACCDEGKDPAALSNGDQKQCQAGKKECKEGKKQCQAAKKECKEGKKQCQADKKECKEGKKQCQAGKKECKEGKKQCQGGKKECKEGKKQCEAAKKDCCQGDKKECKGEKKECKGECKK